MVYYKKRIKTENVCVFIYVYKQVFPWKHAGRINKFPLYMERNYTYR